MPSTESRCGRDSFASDPRRWTSRCVAYVVAKDWPHFLEIQEELLLGIMEIVEQAGTAIALPSQTLHLAEASPLAAGSPTGPQARRGRVIWLGS